MISPSRRLSFLSYIAIMLSVIIPTLNAAVHLPATLAALAEGRAGGFVVEIVIVDGGSTDQTLRLAGQAGANVIQTVAGPSITTVSYRMRTTGPTSTCG